MEPSTNEAHSSYKCCDRGIRWDIRFQKCSDTARKLIAYYNDDSYCKWCEIGFVEYEMTASELRIIKFSDRNNNSTTFQILITAIRKEAHKAGLSQISTTADKMGVCWFYALGFDMLEM